MKTGPGRRAIAGAIRSGGCSSAAARWRRPAAPGRSRRGDRRRRPGVPEDRRGQGARARRAPRIPPAAQRPPGVPSHRRSSPRGMALPPGPPIPAATKSLGVATTPATTTGDGVSTTPSRPRRPGRPRRSLRGPGQRPTARGGRAGSPWPQAAGGLEHSLDGRRVEELRLGPAEPE